MPLTRRAKGLMAVESLISYAVVILVVARAVNVLGTGSLHPQPPDCKLDSRRFGDHRPLEEQTASSGSGKATVPGMPRGRSISAEWVMRATRRHLRGQEPAVSDRGGEETRDARFGKPHPNRGLSGGCGRLPARCPRCGAGGTLFDVSPIANDGA